MELHRGVEQVLGAEMLKRALPPQPSLELLLPARQSPELLRLRQGWLGLLNFFTVPAEITTFYSSCLIRCNAVSLLLSRGCCVPRQLA